MSMIRSHGDGALAALLQFKEGFHDTIHVHIALQMVRLEKITLRVSLRAAEMNEIDPIPVTLHDPGQVVITSDTERTCA